MKAFNFTKTVLQHGCITGNLTKFSKQLFYRISVNSCCCKFKVNGNLDCITLLVRKFLSSYFHPVFRQLRKMNIFLATIFCLFHQSDWVCYFLNIIGINKRPDVLSTLNAYKNPWEKKRLEIFGEMVKLENPYIHQNYDLSNEW